MTDKRMTVATLIERLQAMPQDAVIEMPLTQYNKRYPVAYCPLSNFEHTITVAPYSDRTVRIDVDLPENMRTSIRKAA
jgi:hypothetical protein